MQVIYHPQNRAAEYGLLAVNLYGGSCEGQCLYCYCPDVAHLTREQWLLTAPHPRKDIIKLLKKEAPKHYGTNKRCHLTFLNDAYQSLEKEFQITRQALIILKENKIPFQILTKGGVLAERDFDLYGPEDMFGVTLTCSTDNGSKRFEPGASPTSERINSLVKARKRGIATWVSLEPVLLAASSLELIRMTHKFVNHYKIGVLNHIHVGCPADGYGPDDWRQFGISAIELCEKFGVSYFVKKDLADNLDGVKWTQTDTRILNREPLKQTKKELFV